MAAVWDDQLVPTHMLKQTFSGALLLMAFATFQAQADSLLFYIGPQPGSIPVVNGESVGPYPGTLEGSTIGQFLCLDGNINTYWGSNITGTEAHPANQQEDEVAFLASLLLHIANQSGVTLNSASAPNPDPTYTQAFMNAYSGPITFALWDIMGTLSAGEAASEPAGTQDFVHTAEQAYTDIFSNPLSPHYADGQAFLQSVWIFTPTPQGSNQRFVTAVDDEGLFSPPVNTPTTPEPASLALFGTGLLLVLVGRLRKKAR
ncbi:MAG TPA: PEP-CTERM sorting domain-containing protein [Candidatus Sulfopaludibacter sp.]|jgi:hypothetical protein|nr:PEP-CTERM sorting domain-containing protein [Candidatus Sulfopaludibacter sp.]